MIYLCRIFWGCNSMFCLIYFLVEGITDERFIEKIIIPLISDFYHDIKIWKYAKIKKAKTNNLIKSLKSMNTCKLRVDYIMLIDIDNTRCIRDRIDEICLSMPEIEKNKIQVVVKEIESWYLAGVSKDLSEINERDFIYNNESITKEGLQNNIPKYYDSTIDYMEELLNNYDIRTAEKRNSSFNYFISIIVSLISNLKSEVASTQEEKQ